MKISEAAKAVFFFGLTALFTVSVEAQDPLQSNADVLDMKLALLDSKIELFNAQLEVWEMKPQELEQRLMAVDERIAQLEFDPVYFNKRLAEIEYLIEEYRKAQAKEEAMKAQAKARSGKLRKVIVDTTSYRAYRTAIYLNPSRLYEGTFHLGYERALNPRLSLDGSVMITYAAEEGLSRYYMSNQRLDYYNEALSSFIPYINKDISGYGLELKLKNYLLTRHYRKREAPVGLYASPGLMFRRLWLSGMTNYYYEGEMLEEEVTQLLNIYALSATVGWKFPFLRVLFVDAYVGGQVKLSRYDGADRFTRYKKLGNVDFSGVMPTVGLNIGILR